MNRNVVRDMFGDGTRLGDLAGAPANERLRKRASLAVVDKDVVHCERRDTGG